MDNLPISKSYFVIAAGLPFLLSVYLWFTGAKDQGLFVTALVLVPLGVAAAKDRDARR